MGVSLKPVEDITKTCFCLNLLYIPLHRQETLNCNHYLPGKSKAAARCPRIYWKIFDEPGTVSECWHINYARFWAFCMRQFKAEVRSCKTPQYFRTDRLRQWEFSMNGRDSGVILYVTCAYRTKINIFCRKMQNGRWCSLPVKRGVQIVCVLVSLYSLSVLNVNRRK